MLGIGRETGEFGKYGDYGDSAAGSAELKLDFIDF
jgi:hypothetical protein